MTVPYAAVLLDDGRRLLLGRQYGGYPCPPGGAIEDGETRREAAAREVWEETRVVVRPDELTEVRQVVHTGKGNSVTHHGWWYAARTWQGEPVNVEPTKCEGWHWYAYDALPDGMDDHTAATIAAYVASRTAEPGRHAEGTRAAGPAEKPLLTCINKGRADRI